MSLYEGIKTAIIYGAGKGGALTYKHLLENGVEVIAFIDDFKTGEYFGKPIIKLEDLDKYKADGYFIGTAESIKKILDWASKLEYYVDKERILYSNIPACDKNGNTTAKIFFSPPEYIDNHLNLFEDNDFKRDLIKYFNKIKQKNKFFISIKDFIELQDFLLRYKSKSNDEVYSYDEINFDVEEGDVVLDCGANSSNGELNALYFSKKVGKNGKVYAFEPIPRIYEELLEDIKNYGNIIAIKMGLSNKKQKTYFQDLGIGSKISENGNIEVELTTIDDFVRENNIPKVDFMKMDIEGAELDALKGAINTIKTFKPKLAICVYHKPEHFYEIPQFIKSIVPEYKIWLLNNEFRLDMWGGTKVFCKV